LAAICAAVVAFDCLKSYDQFTSSALVHLSVLNRLIIVVQVLLVAFHPWTKRIGSCVIPGPGFGGLRALSAFPAIGPVGASMLQAASASRPTRGRTRVERKNVWLMKKSK
jgi:hypothetical protein